MIRQFLAIIVARLVSAGLQAAVGIALARTVTPSLYGQVTATAGVLLFLFIIAGLGVPSYLGRARALHLEAHVVTALRLNLSTTLIGVLAAASLITSGLTGATGSVAVYLAALALGAGLDKNIDCALAVPVADGLVRDPATSIILRRVVTAGIFFVLLYYDRNPVLSYCLASLLGPVAGQAHLIRMLRRLVPAHGPGAPYLEVVRAAVPYAVNDIALQSRSVDTALVAVVITPAAAGLYSGAAKLTAPFELVSSTLASVVLPRSVGLTQNGRIRLALRLTIAASVLVAPCALVAAYAGPVVTFVLGENYRGASTCLAVFMLALPSIALSSPLTGVLQGAGAAAFVARLSLIFAVLTLVAIGLGSSLGSAAGAATGILVVSVAKNVALWWGIMRGDRGSASRSILS